MCCFVRDKMPKRIDSFCYLELVCYFKILLPFWSLPLGMEQPCAYLLENRRDLAESHLRRRPFFRAHFLPGASACHPKENRGEQSDAANEQSDLSSVVTWSLPAFVHARKWVGVLHQGGRLLKSKWRKGWEKGNSLWASPGGIKVILQPYQLSKSSSDAYLSSGSQFPLQTRQRLQSGMEAERFHIAREIEVLTLAHTRLLF